MPAHRSAVSSDGSRYAYTEGWSAGPSGKAPRLHVVSVADGSERTVQVSEALPWGVVDLASDGIHLRACFEGCSNTVLKIDLSTGASHTLGVSGLPVDGPAGSRWMATTNPADPHPETRAFDGQPVPNQFVQRRSGGSTVVWFYKPGFAVNGYPFADGNQALVFARQQEELEIWLVTSPGRFRRLVGPGYAGELQYAPFMADNHGLWFGSQSGITHVTPAGEFANPFKQAAYVGNGCQ